MLRAAFIQAAKKSTRPASLGCARVIRQPWRGPVRFQSDKATDPRRQAIEHNDDMQRDWDARILTYEEVKPKTLNPTLVSAPLNLPQPSPDSIALTGCVPDRRP
jgi:hypothetical protein